MSAEDWVKEKGRRVHWDKDVHSAADVKAGQTYYGNGTEGKTYQSSQGTVQLGENGSFSVAMSEVEGIKKPVATEAKPTITTPDKANEEEPEVGNEKVSKGADIAHNTIDAVDNTARISIQKGFEAANEASPAEALEAGSKAAGTAGKVLGAAGIVLTGVSALTDPKGVQLKHVIDATVGAATFIPVAGEVIGVAWFIGNLVSMGINGKSLSENIQSGVEKKVGEDATHFGRVTL